MNEIAKRVIDANKRMETSAASLAEKFEMEQRLIALKYKNELDAILKEATFDDIIQAIETKEIGEFMPIEILLEGFSYHTDGRYDDKLVEYLKTRAVEALKKTLENI